MIRGCKITLWTLCVVWVCFSFGEAVAQTPSPRQAASPPARAATTQRQAPPARTTPPAQAAASKASSKGDDVQREYAKDFIRDYWSRGPVLAFLLILFAGFLVSLTPCVYPMIPITIAVIGAASGKHQSRWHSFVMAFFYVVGMAIPYATLGVVVAYIGRQPIVLGAVFNSPYFLGFLVILFGLMALSMFGVFDLALPTSWQTKMSMFQGKGYLGIIVLGMIGALLATPCSGPVIVGLLAFIAQTGDVTWGILMPTVFTFGIGIPFLVLGGGVVQALPRSGKWMTIVKKIFGVILLAACLYYGYLLYRRLAPRHVKVGAQVQQCLPPANYPADKPYWFTSEKVGAACAKKLKRPLIIDFWAEWCTACKQLERESFNTRMVAKESRRFIMVKYEYNESSKEDERLRKKYGIRGLPWVRFVDAQGNVLKKPRIVGFVKADKLLQMMRQVH